MSALPNLRELRLALLRCNPHIYPYEDITKELAQRMPHLETFAINHYEDDRTITFLAAMQSAQFNPKHFRIWERLNKHCVMAVADLLANSSIQGIDFTLKNRHASLSPVARAILARQKTFGKFILRSHDGRVSPESMACVNDLLLHSSLQELGLPIQYLGGQHGILPAIRLTHNHSQLQVLDLRMDRTGDLSMQDVSHVANILRDNKSIQDLHLPYPNDNISLVPIAEALPYNQTLRMLFLVRELRPVVGLQSREDSLAFLSALQENRNTTLQGIIFVHLNRGRTLHSYRYGDWSTYTLPMTDDEETNDNVRKINWYLCWNRHFGGFQSAHFVENVIMDHDDLVLLSSSMEDLVTLLCKLTSILSNSEFFDLLTSTRDLNVLYGFLQKKPEWLL